MYIDGFNPQDDDGWFDGDVEVRFEIDFSDYWRRDTVIYRNVPAWQQNNEAILVMAQECDPADPPVFTLRLWEEDPLWDDFWGQYQYPPYPYNVMYSLWYDGDRKMWINFVCR